MGLIDTLKTVLGIGEPLPALPLWAYHVTTWIGSGKEWGAFWFCWVCLKRGREQTEVETAELGARATYEHYRSLLVRTIGMPPEEEEAAEALRILAAQGMDDLEKEYPSIAEPYACPSCPVCGIDIDMMEWDLAMGKGLDTYRNYPEEGPQRPNIPDYIGYMEDVTGQFVHLAKGSPNPNVVVVKVGELREKHKGSLSRLALDTGGVMLERQQEPEATLTKQVSDDGVKNWLKTQGFTNWEVIDITSLERTEKVVGLARKAGPRPEGM